MIVREARPDPKPAARIIDATVGYDKLRREQRCRLCGRFFAYGLGLSRHHLVPRGQGGDDVAENIVPLCGDGTRGCHGKVEHYRSARVKLRARLRREETRYAIRRMGDDGREPEKGRAWLDRRYPPSP
jgi:hypothetical protein